MKIYNQYILLTTAILLLTTVVFVAMGQTALNIYYDAYVVEALIITELYAYFNTRAQRGLTQVSLVLFGGFLFIVLIEVITVLAQMQPI